MLEERCQSELTTYSIARSLVKNSKTNEYLATDIVAYCIDIAKRVLGVIKRNFVDRSKEIIY